MATMPPPRPLYSICLLLLLFIPALYSSVAAAPTPPFCSRRRGGFWPVGNITDPNLRQMAELAVSEYNKQLPRQWLRPRWLFPQYSRLVFQNVLRAESQFVGGQNYRLVITAINEMLPNNPPLRYEAIVHQCAWKRLKHGCPWEDFRRLLSFVQV